MHDVRNGPAHGDGDRLAAAGYRRDVDEVRRWEATLDALADAMDRVVGDRLARVLGGVRPW